MKLPFRETAITSVCVAILLGLGTWQVQRLHWKNEIIAKLEEAYDQKPPPFLDAARLEGLSHEEHPFSFGEAEGHFLRDKAILLGPRTDDGRLGYHLIVPLETKENKTLLVNLGWVSDMWKDNTEGRLADLPLTPVKITGAVRKPDWTTFTSKNSPSNDLWFRADIGEIAAAKELAAPYPFFLYATETQPLVPDDIKRHAADWFPRNKHLEYALFWYGLAVIMTGIYLVYVRKKAGK
jgi:surfeit locus 1 family protein